MKTTTVFTPTYNRAYIIKKLYESLLQQTNSDFEWLIVDDGSTDNTKELIQLFINDGKINIRYYYKINEGKHTAINMGVQKAKGELFFIVDSDDYIADNAIERILYHYFFIKEDINFAGICGLKAYSTGKKVGDEVIFNILNCNSLDFRFKYKIKGDMAEVFRTEILREYKFPDIAGEKFCPEALVWNRISQKYSLRYFYEKIYFCEYLSDGLTAQMVRLRIENVESSLLYYLELNNYNIPIWYKIRASINYWRFAPYSKRDFNKKLKDIGLQKSIIALPLGILFFLKDYIKNG
ncbi:Hyaluronan synthase [termite gut metagenome]|uniref:Hyaluronan synthase n=1 Tax=termite gut metagenome TaxID=433724 RepID=A0A5J4R6Q5_9ZZZZ